MQYTHRELELVAHLLDEHVRLLNHELVELIPQTTVPFWKERMDNLHNVINLYTDIQQKTSILLWDE